MEDQPSLESTARRPLIVWISVLVVGMMFLAYAYVYVRVGRHQILLDNIEWLRAVGRVLLD